MVIPNSGSIGGRHFGAFWRADAQLQAMEWDCRATPASRGGTAPSQASRPPRSRRPATRAPSPGRRFTPPEPNRDGRRALTGNEERLYITLGGGFVISMDEKGKRLYMAVFAEVVFPLWVLPSAYTIFYFLTQCCSP
jgi:hypothetical protein